MPLLSLNLFKWLGSHQISVNKSVETYSYEKKMQKQIKEGIKFLQV